MVLRLFPYHSRRRQRPQRFDRAELEVAGESVCPRDHQTCPPYKEKVNEPRARKCRAVIRAAMPYRADRAFLFRAEALLCSGDEDTAARGDRQEMLIRDETLQDRLYSGRL